MKTEVIKTKEAISEYVDSLDNDELVELHNEYCRDCNYPDDEIYSNDENFFNEFFGNNVLKAVRAVSYGEYNYSHTYVKFNGYANLDSFNNPEPEIDKDAIIKAIMDETFTPYDLELIDPEEETED